MLDERHSFDQYALAMQFLSAAEDSEQFLIEELRRVSPTSRHEIHAPGLIASNLPLPVEPQPLVFARQLLPTAAALHADSINAWSQHLFTALATLPDAQPWRLHITPRYETGRGGEQRCRLIRDALRDRLRQHRRHLLRALQDQPAAFTPTDSLVQLCLTAPDAGILSVAPTPQPFALRRFLSPFPAGTVNIPTDKAAPCRAFAKLVEAELRLGRRILTGETCADLGACPGSWSYVALQRGARVIAVDRSSLRTDLMRHPALQFVKGDAFGFKPDAPVDWLLCDVIAAPARSVGLLRDWLRERWMRHFVVTIKFKGAPDHTVLDELKSLLSVSCDEYYLTRLCANKNEACAFGEVRS